jgi:hypothetical protein
VTKSDIYRQLYAVEGWAIMARLAVWDSEVKEMLEALKEIKRICDQLEIGLKNGFGPR